MADWQENLETMGAEIFQNYRKRLMQPGIAMEIRRAYPGLSMVDVLIRVHAGRRIIQDGDDFRALHAIRSGLWQQIRQEPEKRPVLAEGRRDQVSRLLVNLGGFLFAGFCLLSLLAAVSDGPGGWLIAGIGLGFAVALVWWRYDSGGAGGDGLSSAYGSRLSLGRTSPPKWGRRERGGARRAQSC
jgi:hypothetical protein